MSGGEFRALVPLVCVLVLLTAAGPAHAAFTARTSATATFRAAASFAPRSVEPPTISGPPVVGAPLVAHPGAWSPQPDAIAIRWEVDGRTVASGDRHTPAAAGPLRAVVTAWRGSRSATASAAVDVLPASAPVNTAPPAISGTPSLGTLLSGRDGTWSHFPTAYTRTWLRCGAACTQVASGASYTVTAADIGYALRHRVVAVNSAGSAAAESALSPGVAPAPVGTFETSGFPFTSVRAGVLKAAQWTVNPALAATYALEWWRCPDAGFSIATCTRVGTASTYTLSTADVGSHVRARHVATQNGVQAAQLAAAIGPVAPLPPLLPATVTSTIVGTAGPAWAADGQTSTVWTAGPSRAGEWLQLDFGAVRALAAYEATYQARPVAFEISLDGVAWTPIPVDPSQYVLGPAVDLRPMKARYLRLRVTTDNPVSWDVFDIRVWGS